MNKFLKLLPSYSRVLVAVLATVGLVGVLPVSLAELQTGKGCPHLGLIPACHVVSVAYGLILVSVIQNRFWKYGLFFWGWVPVFFLAVFGSGLELLGQDACPKTESGWPKCFSSLILASVIFLPLPINWFTKKSKKTIF